MVAPSKSNSPQRLVPVQRIRGFVALLQTPTYDNLVFVSKKLFLLSSWTHDEIANAHMLGEFNRKGDDVGNIFRQQSRSGETLAASVTTHVYLNRKYLLPLAVTFKDVLGTLLVGSVHQVRLNDTR